MRLGHDRGLMMKHHEMMNDGHSNSLNAAALSIWCYRRTILFCELPSAMAGCGASSCILLGALLLFGICWYMHDELRILWFQVSVIYAVIIGALPCIVLDYAKKATSWWEWSQWAWRPVAQLQQRAIRWLVVAAAVGLAVVLLLFVVPSSYTLVTRSHRPLHVATVRSSVVLSGIPDCPILPRPNLMHQLAHMLQLGGESGGGHDVINDAGIDRRAESQIVLLEAAAGSGKTKAVEQLRDYLTARSHVVWLLGYCRGKDMVQQLLNEYIGRHASEEYVALLDGSRPLPDIAKSALRRHHTRSNGKTLVIMLDGCSYDESDTTSALAVWVQIAPHLSTCCPHVRLLLSVEPSAQLQARLKPQRVSLSSVREHRAAVANCTHFLLNRLFDAPTSTNLTLADEIVRAYPSNFLLTRLFFSHAIKHPTALSQPEAQSIDELWAKDIGYRFGAAMDLAPRLIAWWLLGIISATHQRELHVDADVMRAVLRSTSPYRYPDIDYDTAVASVLPLLDAAVGAPLRFFHSSITAFLLKQYPRAVALGHLRLGLWGLALSAERATVQRGAPLDVCQVQRLAGMCSALRLQQGSAAVTCPAFHRTLSSLPARVLQLPEPVLACYTVHHLAEASAMETAAPSLFPQWLASHDGEARWLALASSLDFPHPCIRWDIPASLNGAIILDPASDSDSPSCITAPWPRHDTTVRCTVQLAQREALRPIEQQSHDDAINMLLTLIRQTHLNLTAQFNITVVPAIAREVAFSVPPDISGIDIQRLILAKLDAQPLPRSQQVSVNAAGFCGLQGMYDNAAEIFNASAILPHIQAQVDMVVMLGKGIPDDHILKGMVITEHAIGEMRKKVEEADRGMSTQHMQN